MELFFATENFTSTPPIGVRLLGNVRTLADATFFQVDYRPSTNPSIYDVRIRFDVEKETPASARRVFQKKIQATTYFPLSSIIGADGLNGRVRNGNGCDPVAMVTWKNMGL